MQQLSLTDYLQFFKYRKDGITVNVRVFFNTITVEARIDGKWHVYQLTANERLIIVDEDHNVQETTDPAAIERFLDTIARKVIE